MSLSPQVLTDCRIYIATADATGVSNKIEYSVEYEELDRTTFASGGAKERCGGLADMSANIGHFWQAGDLSMPDDTFWANLGVATVPLTVIPTSGAVGTLAYVTRVLECSYKPMGEVGKLLSATVDLKGTWPVARGAVLHPQGTARTATGTGTAQQLGALSSAQSLYVTYHLLSITADSGSPTLTVKIQSDDNSGFTSATDRGTFTVSSALDGQTMKIDGAITDDYWRAAWTVAGGATNPSVLFAVAAGIAHK
jgi:hypothetical protein